MLIFLKNLLDLRLIWPVMRREKIMKEKICNYIIYRETMVQREKKLENKKKKKQGAIIVLSLYIPVCKLRFGEIWVSDDNLRVRALKKKGNLGNKEREREREKCC